VHYPVTGPDRQTASQAGWLADRDRDGGRESECVRVSVRERDGGGERGGSMFFGSVSTNLVINCQCILVGMLTAKPPGPHSRRRLSIFRPFLFPPPLPHFVARDYGTVTSAVLLSPSEFCACFEST
jgi:hypothetical protein